MRFLDPPVREALSETIPLRLAAAALADCYTAHKSTPRTARARSTRIREVVLPMTSLRRVRSRGHSAVLR